MGHWLDSNKEGQKCDRCKGSIALGDRIYRKLAGVYYCNGCGIIADGEPHVAGEVEQGVEDDLALLPPAATKTSLARSMILLARSLDGGDVPPREVPTYTKEIRLFYMQLKELFPPQDDADPTQQMRDQRERRMRELGEYN